MRPGTGGGQNCWHRTAEWGEEAGDLLGPLQQPVESAGEGSTSGATRAKLVEAREKLLGQVLLKALEVHPEQAHRAVWSWPERDKSSAR